MNPQESQIKTKDGVTLFTRTWLSDKPARALVVLVHGIGEHCGRYMHVAKFFNEHGINVFSYDQRGHGRSEGARGYIPSTQALMDDLNQALEVGRAAVGQGLPVILYGHSMGALEALYFGLHNDLKVNGVIVTGPSLDISTTSKVKRLMAKLMAPLLPKLALASGLDVTALSRDPQVMKDYVADPLGHDRVSTRLGMFFIGGAQEVLAKAAEWKLPLLLMHGTEDRLALINGSEQFIAKAKGDITFKRYQGYYHELHNEPEKAEVLQTMVDWIDKHI